MRVQVTAVLVAALAAVVLATPAAAQYPPPYGAPYPAAPGYGPPPPGYPPAQPGYDPYTAYAANPYAPAGQANPWAPYYPWPPAGGQGAPTTANQPGQAPPGTNMAVPGANVGAQVGPASFASATGAPGTALPPAPTAGGAFTDQIRIVDATDNRTGLDPTPARVVVNQPITWVNTSSSIVQIVAEDGSSFDSGPLAPGDTFTFTPTLIGTFYYRDKLRPWVRGAVVAVPEPPARPQPAAQGDQPAPQSQQAPQGAPPPQAQPAPYPPPYRPYPSQGPYAPYSYPSPYQQPPPYPVPQY